MEIFSLQSRLYILHSDRVCCVLWNSIYKSNGIFIAGSLSNQVLCVGMRCVYVLPEHIDFQSKRDERSNKKKPNTSSYSVRHSETMKAKASSCVRMSYTRPLVAQAVQMNFCHLPTFFLKYFRIFDQNIFN